MAIFNPQKLRLRTRWTGPGTFYALCLEPAGDRLFCGGDDGEIHPFDFRSTKLLPAPRWIRHDNYISALTWIQQAPGPLLISGSYDRRLIWWNPVDGHPWRVMNGHAGWIRSLVALGTGRQFASAGDDMLVKIWETTSGRLQRICAGHESRTPQGHVTALYALAASPDGRYLASGDRAGKVCIWEVETGNLATHFLAPLLYTYDERQRKRSIGGIRALAFSSDGRHLAVGGIGHVENVDGLSGPARIEIWDWRIPRRLAAEGAQGHNGIVNRLEFTPDDSWLIGAGGGSDNGFLAFWKTDQLASKATGSQPAISAFRIKTDGHIHAFQFHPSRNELYMAGYGGIQIWSPAG